MKKRKLLVNSLGLLLAGGSATEISCVQNNPDFCPPGYVCTKVGEMPDLLVKDQNQSVSDDKPKEETLDLARPDLSDVYDLNLEDLVIRDLVIPPDQVEAGDLRDPIWNYKNFFSDPKTISHFKQEAGNWRIIDLNGDGVLRQDTQVNNMGENTAYLSLQALRNSNYSVVIRLLETQQPYNSVRMGIIFRYDPIKKTGYAIEFGNGDRIALTFECILRELPARRELTKVRVNGDLYNPRWFTTVTRVSGPNVEFDVGGITILKYGNLTNLDSGYLGFTNNNGKFDYDNVFANSL